MPMQRQARAVIICGAGLAIAGLGGLGGIGLANFVDSGSFAFYKQQQSSPWTDYAMSQPVRDAGFPIDARGLPPAKPMRDNPIDALYREEPAPPPLDAQPVSYASAEQTPIADPESLLTEIEGSAWRGSWAQPAVAQAGKANASESATTADAPEAAAEAAHSPLGEPDVAEFSSAANGSSDIPRQ